MNKVIIYVLLMFGLFSCNKESIKITGSLKGSNASEVELKLKSRRGNENIILTDLAVEDGEFDAYLENVKPPCKMTLVIDGEKEYDFWIFRYGKFDFEIDENEVLIVNNSIENSEYDRIQKNYHKMYLVKLQEKEKWVQTHEIEENLTEEDEAKLFEYRKEIKKAYKLRKKSILSTFRKNPQNPIAMALLFDEYERLTSWQKEECLKNAQKHFSDCGINWQLRN